MPEYSIGRKQAIPLTLLREDFGRTDEEHEACLRGLAAAGISTRTELEAHINRTVSTLLEKYRATGLSYVERKKIDAEREEIVTHVEALAAKMDCKPDTVLEQLGIELPDYPEEPGVGRPFVVVARYSGKAGDPNTKYGYGGWCEITADGHHVGDGGNLGECPEDANLGRDLNFVYSLPESLRRAWEAGAEGRPFDIKHEEDQSER